MNKEIGVLFDMDGVIIDNHKYHYKAWEQIGEKYNKMISPEDYKNHMNGRTLMEVVAYIFDEPMTAERAREVGLEKEKIYRALYQPYLSPTLGLMKFLSDLQAAGIPMVIGTSAPVENVHFTIQGLGIGHYFKSILDERAVTKGKPDPQIYIKCAEAISCAPSKCVVFEDAISGLKAGKSAGAKTVALATSHSREELQADLIIDNFTHITVNQVIDLIYA